MVIFFPTLQHGNDLQQRILKERTVITLTFDEVLRKFKTEPNFMITVYDEYLGSDILDACKVEIIPQIQYPASMALAVQFYSPYAEILEYV
jgi:hypothetical protein